MKKLSPFGIRTKDYPHDLYHLHKNKKVGKFELLKRTIPKGFELQFYKDGIGMCRCIFDTPYRTIALLEDSNTWMSDTPMEYETNHKAIELAKGDVLECGLGIGLFTYYASKKNQVKNITIVEETQDIIDLVYPAIKNKKTKIINEKVKPFIKHTKKRFDMIHVDIWESLLPYREIDSMLKLAKRVLKPNGVVVCWLDDVWEIIKKNVNQGARQNKGFQFNIAPCHTCAKTDRFDFGGFCMDCADDLGISELFLKAKPKLPYLNSKRLKIIANYK